MRPMPFRCMKPILWFSSCYYFKICHVMRVWAYQSICSLVDSLARSRSQLCTQRSLWKHSYNCKRKAVVNQFLKTPGTVRLVATFTPSFVHVLSLGIKIMLLQSNAGCLIRDRKFPLSSHYSSLKTLHHFAILQDMFNSLLCICVCTLIAITGLTLFGAEKNRPNQRSFSTLSRAYLISCWYCSKNSCKIYYFQQTQWCLEGRFFRD